MPEGVLDDGATHGSFGHGHAHGHRHEIMNTLGEILKLSTAYLEQRSILKPRLSAERLLAHSLKMKRLDLYVQFDRPLEEEELKTYRQLLKQRGQGVPVEYLTRQVDFYGCSLEITPDVLIPRPETEILLDKVCGMIQGEPVNVLDLCTGSGCLAIGLKKRLPDLQVFASDFSAEAVQLAEQNAKRNEVLVDFRQGDLLAPFWGMKFRYVLCNPPYLSEAEYEQIDKEVRLFEPKLALVGGKEGDTFFKRLAIELPAYLEEGAHLFFEIGASQGEIVRKIFDLECWRKKSVERDFAGHPRFFFCQYCTT